MKYIKNISQETFNEDIKSSKKLIIIDFWAAWCNPCIILGSILEKISKKYKDKVKIFKLNVDNNQEILEKFSIRNIPTLIFYKNKKQIFKNSGLLSESQIISNIKKFL